MQPIKIRNKLFKHQAVIENEELKQYSPETFRFSKDHLFHMLDQYENVIIKPIRGSGGKGVRKITVLPDGTFMVRYQDQEIIINDKSSLYQYFKKIERLRKWPFIIQQYISLATIDKKPIDFRYITQRKKGTIDWMVTGKHAKLAGEGFVVTNLQKGAEVLTVEEALKKSNINNLNIKKTLEELDHISLLATLALSKHFKSHTIWGYDMAVDESGHIWIIEANCTPLVGGFRYLDDLEMYETINFYKDYNKKYK